MASDCNDLQKSWLERGSNVLMNTYASFPIVMKQGRGSYVEDVNGKRYLDFVSGIAVNSLGHCNAVYVKAMTEQLQTLNHCSNLYLNIPGIELAESLVSNSVFDRVFFCNSGTEAIEGTIKLVRKYAKENKSADCTTILTMSNSFHGRTYGSLSATGQTKYQDGFQPLVPDFQTVPFNDIAAIKALNLKKVAAIYIEPIQGEGGIHLADTNFLREVRELCTKENIVLVFDEIQCGLGRTGKFYAYENFGAEPDVIALAKGLGGGFPIGAILAKEQFAKAFQPGNHGSTFGGNPLACTAALTCVKTIRQPEFLAAIRQKSDLLIKALTELKAKNSHIVDVRGMGLMIGVEMDAPVKSIVQDSINRGLLLCSAGEKVFRFLPPLNVSEQELKDGVGIFAEALAHADATLTPA